MTQEMEMERWWAYELEFPQDKSIWLESLLGKFLKREKKIISMKKATWSFLGLIKIHLSLKIYNSFIHTTEEILLFQM